MEITIDLKNYHSENSIFKRSAARGIIAKGDQYLLIYSKYGEYKFPGGGVESEEDIEEALIREVKEETGYQVIESSITSYGKVLERRKGITADIMEMESNYFLCEVEREVGNRKLDEYEKDYDYQIAWISLSEAINRNKSVIALEECPWVIRDTQVMEYLLGEKSRNKDILTHILSDIPEEMRNKIEGQGFTVDTIGCSGSHIFIFDNNLVLKVEGKNDISDGEYQMMRWLQGKLPVPEILHFYSDDRKNYLLMTKIEGKMACDPELMKDSSQVVRLLGKGLKKLWTVDMKECPRTINLDYKLKRAKERIINNELDLEHAETDTFTEQGFRNPMELYEYLENHKPLEEPVLIHGDYCLPNVFLYHNEVAGFIDLGLCGIGDKWQDIALAVRSLKHNLQDMDREEELQLLQNILFEELGIEADEEKIRYYILLDELF